VARPGIPVCAATGAETCQSRRAARARPPKKSYEPPDLAIALVGAAPQWPDMEKRRPVAAALGS
jgi:hypothetical protein